ncbi:MAG: cyclophilin-like fold protein, partial [Bacillota bacterium]|nr:cyclophilin-like fold protein [Bacillota bacterium]
TEGSHTNKTETARRIIPDASTSSNVSIRTDNTGVTDSARISEIQTGDLMLYGSDCLVLFYNSFSTSYSYTRLGRIEDPAGVVEALGNGSVSVKIDIEK